MGYLFAFYPGHDDAVYWIYSNWLHRARKPCCIDADYESNSILLAHKKSRFCIAAAMEPSGISVASEHASRPI